MAEVPYAGGVPEVAPQVQTPDDYQHIQTNAAQFGGDIAQGMQQFGQGALKASIFYGQAAADSTANDTQDKINKILHGDPSKTIPGPDGQMVPDTGFLGLKGRAALDARPGVSTQIDTIIANARKNLSTPEQQLQFDNFSRRYRAMAIGQIGEHSDQQANAWYGQVNKDTETLALGHISTNAENPLLVANGTSDLIDARVKNAELQGAQKGDPVWNAAVEGGKRDALVAQVNAIGVKDPAKALDILEQNKGTAGILYDNVANSLRARADQQIGQQAGAKAIEGAHQAATATGGATPASQLFSGIEGQYGLPAGFLGKTMQIESGGRNLGPNQAGAAGYFQFVRSTAAHMGVNPNDLKSSADGAARLAVENAKQLRLGIGHEPDGAELYLAHQQGAGGASKLLNNPDANAASLVGTNAIIQNGGREDMTAREFTQMWANKYNGVKGATHVVPGASPQGTALPNTGVTPTAAPDVSTVQLLALSGVTPPPGAPAGTSSDQTPQLPTGASSATQQPIQPLSLKADAYQTVMDNKDLSPEARAHALTYINQTLAAQQIAQEADERAKKAQNDHAADQYVQQMQAGNYNGIVQSIAENPALEWQTRVALHEMALKGSGSDVEQDTQAYGKGFWDVFKRVTAPVGDPNRISDPTEIMRRAGPGGDLTLAGVGELTRTLQLGQRSVDDQAVNTSRAALINYAKSKLSFEEDTGPIKIRDPKGEAIFSAQFVPKFMASYDSWTKQGKNPWDFLTQENVDKMIAGMRPAAQMAQDRMSAMGEAAGGANDNANAPLPPAPANVNPNAWNQIIATPPASQDGTQFPRPAWASALNLLLTNPTPEMIQMFNNSKFGKAGYDGAEILKKLNTAPGENPEPVTVIAPEDRRDAKIRNASIGHVR